MLGGREIHKAQTYCLCNFPVQINRGGDGRKSKKWIREVYAASLAAMVVTDILLSFVFSYFFNVVGWLFRRSKHS